MRDKQPMIDLIKKPVFWKGNIRNQLFMALEDYMEKNDLSRKDLAKKLGVSKGYVSQVLNGDTNHRLSKIVELLVSIGKAPYIYLKDIDDVVSDFKKKDKVLIDFAYLEKTQSFHTLKCVSTKTPKRSVSGSHHNFSVEPSIFEYRKGHEYTKDYQIDTNTKRAV